MSVSLDFPSNPLIVSNWKFLIQECHHRCDITTRDLGVKSVSIAPKTEHVNELERLLRTVSTIIKRRGRDILSDFDITPPQFNALLILVNNGNLTIGELGERMYLACSTATDLIDRMERNGLVARVRDENDRRVIRLHVNEKGFEMVEAVMSARKKYLSGILEGLNADETEVIIEGMRHIEQLMTQAEATKAD